MLCGKSASAYFKRRSGRHFSFDFGGKCLRPKTIEGDGGVAMLDDGDEEMWLDLVSLLHRESSKPGGVLLSRLGSHIPKPVRGNYYPVSDE